MANNASPVEKALEAAKARLNRRMMSRSMVDRKLADLDYEPPTRQAVLERLQETGLVDDEAFGAALIRETQRTRPAGPRLLRKKLHDKGLDKALIDRLIEQNTPHPADQREAATDLARKRLATMSGLDRTKQLRRLQGLLARRGFDAQITRDVLETLDAESG